MTRASWTDCVVFEQLTIRFVVCCIAIGALGCGSATEPIVPDPALACVSITGNGTTQGDRNQLAGDGVFRFDDLERQGLVGLYLFDIAPADNNGLNVETKYQFHWDGGDSFLSEDRIYFEPTFEANTYRFSAQLTIIAGSGMFSNMVGERPLTLTAEMTFGPPAVPGGVMTVSETFELGGSVCR